MLNSEEDPWKMLVSTMGLMHRGSLWGAMKRLFACGKLTMAGAVCRSLASDQTPVRTVEQDLPMSFQR